MEILHGYHCDECRENGIDTQPTTIVEVGSYRDDVFLCIDCIQKAFNLLNAAKQEEGA